MLGSAQTVQGAPPEPQAAMSVPGWQAPLGLQQPRQLEGEQVDTHFCPTQAPLLGNWIEQFAQSSPLAPHW